MANKVKNFMELKEKNIQSISKSNRLQSKINKLKCYFRSKQLENQGVYFPQVDLLLNISQAIADKNRVHINNAYEKAKKKKNTY